MTGINVRSVPLKFCDQHNCSLFHPSVSFFCSGGLLANLAATSPSTASLLLNPPAPGVSIGHYTVTACPISGGACITQTCQTINCAVTGLASGTTYSITSSAVTTGGVQLPASSPMQLTLPAAGAPALSAAQALSSTTAAIVVSPPKGSNYTSVRPSHQKMHCVCTTPYPHRSASAFPCPLQYTVTATPTGGGSPVVVGSTSTSILLSGLQPATQVRHCVGVKALICSAR